MAVIETSPTTTCLVLPCQERVFNLTLFTDRVSQTSHRFDYNGRLSKGVNLNPLIYLSRMLELHVPVALADPYQNSRLSV